MLQALFVFVNMGPYMGGKVSNDISEIIHQIPWQKFVYTLEAQGMGLYQCC